jgi:hypothetical protein
MNKIKFYRDSYSISRDMYEHINDPSLVEELTKKEITQRLAKLIFEDLDFYSQSETNPFVGETIKTELVCMPLPYWSKIQTFLERNNFPFNRLNE